MDYDVIVVGAGPAGGMAALQVARRGLRTLLVEEHAQVGAPTHCSGKLQLHAFHEFNLPDHLIMNTLQAGTFYAPGGAVARVRRATPDSHVVDRAVFDRWLAGTAQEHGAVLLTGTRLRAAERVNGLMRVVGDRAGRSFAATAPIIIDAEGARPTLPPTLGLRLPRAFVLGLQYQMAGIEMEGEDCPEVYLGSADAPGFFAWLMPIGGGRGRVGLCVDPRRAARGPVYYLERLIREHPVASRRLRRATVERKLAGPIPVLARHRPSVTEGMLLVGDAAGQVKATSGGGIYFSLIAAGLAADAAAAYVAGDRGAPAQYERRWWRRFGRELRATAFARVALNHMSDADVNAIIRAVGDDDRLRRTVERLGDTAFQSRLVGPLMLAGLRPAHLPALTAVVAKTLWYGVRALWDDGVRPEENGDGGGNG